MRVTAHGRVRVAVALTYAEYRALKISGMNPIEYQHRTNRIQATNHICGQDQVIVEIEMDAGDFVEVGKWAELYENDKDDQGFFDQVP